MISVPYKDKTIITERAALGNHVVMRFKEGGQLPDALTGLFTSNGEAERIAIAFAATGKTDPGIKKVS